MTSKRLIDREEVEAMTDTQQQLAVSIPEAAQLLGVSKPKMYEIASRADFPSVKLGRRILIHRQALDDWLRHQCESDNSP